MKNSIYLAYLVLFSSAFFLSITFLSVSAFLWGSPVVSDILLPIGVVLSLFALVFYILALFHDESPIL